MKYRKAAAVLVLICLWLGVLGEIGFPVSALEFRDSGGDPSLIGGPSDGGQPGDGATQHTVHLGPEILEEGEMRTYETLSADFAGNPYLQEGMYPGTLDVYLDGPIVVEKGAFLKIGTFAIGSDKEASPVLHAALSDEPDGRMYNELGACYKMKIGTDPDGEKEYTAFRLGTAAGDRNALRGYVMCLADGKGVPEDPVKSEYLMSGMVRYGNYLGYRDLAYMFSHYPEDPAARRKTFEYCKLGAAHGHKVAAKKLAWCYRTGYGVECDPERADVLEKEAQTMSEPDGYGHCDVLPMCAVGAETNRICSSEDLFESFLSDICPDPETVQSWLYLIDSDPRVMRNVVGLALKITGEDDPASEGRRRKLTDEELRSLKDFVYLCCETELRLLVRYEGGAAHAKSAPDLIRGKVYPVLRVTETGDYIIADESGEDWTYDGDDFTVVLAEGESKRDGVVQLRLGEKEEKRGDFLRAAEHYSKGIALGCDLCGEAMIRCYDVCEERERPSPAYSAANKPGSKELNCGIEAELWAGMRGYSSRAADLPENAARKTAEAAEHYRKAAEQGNLSAMAHLVHLLSANLAAEAYDGESRDLIARLEEAEI